MSARLCARLSRAAPTPRECTKDRENDSTSIAASARLDFRCAWERRRRSPSLSFCEPKLAPRYLLPLKPVEVLLPIQDEGLGIVRHLQAEGMDQPRTYKRHQRSSTRLRLHA